MNLFVNTVTLTQHKTKREFPTGQGNRRIPCNRMDGAQNKPKPVRPGIATQLKGKGATGRGCDVTVVQQFVTVTAGNALPQHLQTLETMLTFRAA
jgi:hypothetical protein